MSAIAQSMRRVIRRGGWSDVSVVADAPAAPAEAAARAPAVEIAPNDPIVAYLQSAGGTVEVDRLELDSPAVRALREAGVALVVPLVSGGELIGTLNLGPRLSDQQYSSDDKKLLDSLAAQAAPALQVAELVRKQAEEAASRERIEQELRVATLIQQNFLPKELPSLAGWQVSAYYHPAREVGGDFYDFLELPDGQVGVVIGDVTDKGVPAALVMAATRSVLRASAQRIVSPGHVLERVNELMCPDMPPKMFVTCLYGVIDTASGRIRYANAGHDPPYVRTAAGAVELRATGMPLGLLPGISYEEKEAVLAPGETLLLHSDGVVESHSPTSEMFGFPRLLDVVGSHAGRGDLIDRVLTELGAFTGPGWEQEDDITLVALARTGTSQPRELERTLALPSEPGNERGAMQWVAEVVAPLGLEPARLERLKTAVSEAVMNAIEHGNESRPEVPVDIAVHAADGTLAVRITDRGGSASGAGDPELPDLEAKLAGRQSPRGWGLFLIRSMVDEVREESGEHLHTIELRLRLEVGRR
jgi:serine phosphatase RsbU (regulator of sigma subunit)/anti-sigma regulatory factor (Ser/Thr protein kinase)